MPKQNNRRELLSIYWDNRSRLSTHMINSTTKNKRNNEELIMVNKTEVQMQVR